MGWGSALTADRSPTTQYFDGVRVELPVKPYPSQIRMMVSVVKACKNVRYTLCSSHFSPSHAAQRENALLESPTGTGKTLALLCSSIAWLGAYKRFQVNDRGATAAGNDADLQKPALLALTDKTAPPLPALMPPPTPSFAPPTPAPPITTQPPPMLAIKADPGAPIELQDDISDENEGIEITFESTPNKSQKHEHDDEAPKSKFKKFIQDSKSVRMLS